MGEHQPGEVHLARADGGHLPVEDSDRLEVPVEHVADPGVTPAEHGVGTGRGASLEPCQPALDQRRPPAVGDRIVVPGAGPRQVAAQWRITGGIRLQEREGGRRIRDAMQPGDHRHRVVLQETLLLGAGVEQPVVAEVVRAARREAPPPRPGPSGRTACRARRRSAPSTGPSARVRCCILAASRMASNWSWSRYVGKTGTSSAAGATRATNSPSRRSPPSVQAASRTRVSDDIPLAAMPVCRVTDGSAASGSWVVSHSASTFGMFVTSRLDRCIEKSADGAWLTSAASGRTCSSVKQ